MNGFLFGHFIELDLVSALQVVLLGFIGGILSGFIGSGGAFSGILEVRFNMVNEGGSFSAQLPVSFELAQTLTPEVTTIGQTEAYINDAITIEGSGFLDGGNEGTTSVTLDGSYAVQESGSTVPVNGVTVPAQLVEANDRTRATFLWSPLIGGLAPGTFAF